MLVTLDIERIIRDIRTKSHLEVANVADPSVRYRVEAGSEKISEIRRNVAGAVSSLVNDCYRFLDMPGTDEADDEIVGDKVVLDVSAGPRRVAGKEKAFAQKIHEIVVDLAMQKFYVSVSQIEMSKAHAAQADAGKAELLTMLRRKRPPKYLDFPFEETVIRLDSGETVTIGKEDGTETGNHGESEIAPISTNPSISPSQGGGATTRPDGTIIGPSTSPININESNERPGSPTGQVRP